MHGEKKDFRFDKRASKYDGFEGRISRRFYRLLLNQVTLFSGAAILDVGCGTGTMLRKMADVCPINGYGIDMEENMIAEARKKCPGMKLQISKCQQTPFGEGSFDVLTACMAYHHFDDKDGFAREAARILKPGGYLYIADPRFPAVIRKSLNAVFRHANLVGVFYTPQEMAKDFAAHGFLLEDCVADGYAQLIKLKKSEEHCA